MLQTSRSLHVQAKTLRSHTIDQRQKVFDEFLEFPSTFTEYRRRLFFPLQTFWMFLHQVLSGNISCHETLQHSLAWMALKNGTIASPSTSAYCKARMRLELNWLHRIGKKIVEKLERQTTVEDRWRGHTVKVVDGSGLSMPDTLENQNVYPQPSGQKPGCGFPVMHIVALFSLATGAILRVERDRMKTAERPMFRRMWDALQSGDVVLADTGFTSFADFFLLKQRGVDCVMRNHQRRSTGAHTIKKLGRRDKLVLWEKTGSCPQWLTPDAWEAMPNEMIVRQIDVQVDIPGFRTQQIDIVTTLLDAKKYPAIEFADLYRRRWLAEIFLRDIKISMNMDVLKCKTPVMVEKELEMYIIAYNLIRALIFKAAKKHGVDATRISFKSTCDALRQWLPVLIANGHHDAQMIDILIHYIAQFIIPFRPNRTEPRAIKRRQKNYQRMTKPRRQFKESMHRNHYSKCLC